MALKVTVYVEKDKFHSVRPGYGYNHLWSTARKEGTTEQLVLAFIDAVQQISAKLKEHTASASEESAAAQFLVDIGTVLIETLPLDNVTERSDGLEDNASTAQLQESDSCQGLPSPSGSASTEGTIDYSDTDFFPDCHDTDAPGTSGLSNTNCETEHDEKNNSGELVSVTKVSSLTSSASKQSPSKRQTRPSKIKSEIPVKENGCNEEGVLRPCRKSRRLTSARKPYVEEHNDDYTPELGEIVYSDDSDEAEKLTKGRRYKSRPPIKDWTSKDEPQMSHPFMCEICGAGFVRKMLLRDHMCSKHEYTKEESDSAVAKVYGIRGGRKGLRKFKIPGKLFYPNEVDPGKTSDDASERELKPKPMCPKCGSVFGNLTSAQAHFEMECAKSPLHCDICGSDFESTGGYKLHMEAHTNKQNGVEFKCTTCEKVLYHQYMLSQHEATHNRDYMCDICGQGFAMKYQLTRHRNCHTKEQTFACTFCPKVYLSKKSLSGHISQLHEASQIACHICGKVVKEKLMTNHIRIAHSDSDNVECHICHKVLKRQSYLEGHIKEVHEGAGKFPCKWPECGKSFVRKRSLVSHMNVHNDVRPFTCDICSKKFRTKRHLSTHTNWHNGVRSHHCTMCNKSFLTKSNLTKHLVTHRNKVNVLSPKPINVSNRTDAQTIPSSAPPGASHNVHVFQGALLHDVSHDASQVAPHGIPQGAYHGLHGEASNTLQDLHVAGASQEALTVYFTM